MTVPAATSAPVTAGVIAALETIGPPVGDAARPAGSAPYYVVYGGGLAGLAGSIIRPKEDGTHVVQVTCVGRTRVGAEDLRDRARAVLLDKDLTIVGHAVVWSDLAASPPTRREDDAGAPSLFTAVDVYQLHVTPIA